MDLAVGVIIGAAFGKIVDSLVNDIIMPIIGLILGKVDFANLYYVLSAGTPAGPYASLDAARKAGASVFAYGNFINALIAFISIAGAVFFFVIKPMQALDARRGKTADEEEQSDEVVLLGEIRDLLKSGSGS